MVKVSRKLKHGNANVVNMVHLCMCAQILKQRSFGCARVSRVYPYMAWGLDTLSPHGLVSHDHHKGGGGGGDLPDGGF